MTSPPLVGSGDRFRWECSACEDCTVLRPYGELDQASYAGFRDGLIKFAVSEPRAIIVVIDDLRLDSEALLSVFARVRANIGEWPGIPLLLVADTPDWRNRLMRNAIPRFVPVHESVATALRAARAQPAHRRAHLELPPAADCMQRARRFVNELCARWELPDLLADAQSVTSELVENAFLHSRIEGPISLRLELNDDLVTIAVADPDPTPVVLREPEIGQLRRYGLHRVERRAVTWGCTRQWLGGKVVWATLRVGQRS